MPSSSPEQEHWMQMSLAVKRGHTLKGLRKGTMAKLRKTAEGMTESQLRDFARAATKK
jgi:hypothetical protein